MRYYSFVSCLEKNIVIETIKVAEDSDDIIVRAYETANKKTPANFIFHDEIETATECNLLEEEDIHVDFNGRYLSAEFKPFEIKTFKIKFKK